MQRRFVSRDLYLIPKRTADRVTVIRTQNALPPKKTPSGQKDRDNSLPPAA